MNEDKRSRKKNFICHVCHIEGTFCLSQARSLLEDILHLPFALLLHEILPHPSNLNAKSTLVNFS